MGNKTITEHICVKENELWMEEQSIPRLVEQYGTPVFVTSEKALRSNVRKFYQTFKDRYPGNIIVCVGMKANWCLATRKIIVQEGGGGDAFGLGELHLALLAGTDPKKIVVNGPNKSEDILLAALHSGVHINVDDPEELERITRLAAATDKTARVSLRIRMPLHSLEGRRFVDPRYKPPGIDVSKWEREFKFGMEPEVLMEAVGRALNEDRIHLEGIHYHGGIPRRAGYSREETIELMDWIAEIKTRFGWEPSTLNLGGGYPKARYGISNPHPLEEHAEAITSSIRQKAEESGLRLPDLILEPGRWCLEDATVYVTRVGNIKKDRELTNKKWVYVDGSINEMGDPFDPFQGYHPVVIANRAETSDKQVVDICGPLCNAADILASERPIPKVQRGDLIAFLSMGAYNEAFSNQANAMPRSASVLVNGVRSDLIRRRETVQDLFNRDLVPYWLL